MGLAAKIATGLGLCSAKRISRDLLIMRAMAREVAFEQAEGVDIKGLGDECRSAFEKAGRLVTSPALPTGKGDVRMICALLGRQARRLARAFDAGGKRC